MDTIIHQRVALCQKGEYPKAICKMPSGWVVLGDVQFLRGYCLLLPDPVVPHLNSMSEAQRSAYLLDMTRIGDALLHLTDAIRMNYEMLGNIEPALHAHIFPRYNDEPEALRTAPVWHYDWKAARAFDINEDAAIMQQIANKLIADNFAVPCPKKPNQ